MVHKFASTPLLNVQRTMTAPQSTVSAIADVDFDISATSTLNLCTRVTLSPVSDVSNYPAGAFVLLSSEDVAPHASIAEAGRMGQVMRVAITDAVNGYVYFATTAWRSDLFTTDIRLTAMPAGETYVNNLRFSIEAGSGEDLELRTSPVLWLQNCLSPRVTNCDLIESASSGLVATRCVGGEFSHNKVQKIRFTAEPDGQPSNGRSGYGVFMSACDSFAVRSNFFTNCRHAVTDNWTNSSAAGQVHRHGPNFNCMIDDNIVAYPKGAGLDCHSSAVGQHFTGNTVIGARGDTSVLGCGYQIRGEGNILQGNADYDCEVGVQVFENTIDGTQDALIIDHVSRAKKTGLVFSGNASSTRNLTAHIIGGVFETKQVGAAAGTVIKAERANVKFRGTILRPHGQNGGNLVTVIGSGNTNITGEAVYDASAAAGAWALLSTAGTGNTFALKTRRDSDDGVGGDAALVITDLSPDYTLFATTLTADRAVTFSCTGRKRVTIYRTAGGAFNLNVTHSGGTLALAANRGATFEVFGSTVLYVDAQLSSVASLTEATAIADTDLLRIERAGVSMKVLRPNVINQRFITSGTVSAAATLDLAIPADCDVMEIELWNWLPATNSNSLWMRFSQSAAFLAGASDYKWGYQGGSAAFSDAADNQIELNSFYSNVAGQIGNINVRMFRPSAAATIKSAMWYGGYHNTSGLYIGLSGAGNMLANNNAIDGIRFLFSSGNIASGFYAVRAFKYA